jgi:hypothetical protein
VPQHGVGLQCNSERVYLHYVFFLTYFAVFICPSVVCMFSFVRTLPISVAVSLVAYKEKSIRKN